MGDPEQETLVLLHGGMANHAVILSVMRHLVGRYHLIVPDLPGHAGWSTEESIDPMGDDYGRWLLEVLDTFEIERCHFMGQSYGCFVANRLIALAPDRVERAFFMVPAGFVLMSSWAVIKHFLLWVVLLGITGKDKYLFRILDCFFTERPSGEMVELFRLTMTGMKPMSAKHKLVDPAETSGFSRPLHILGCEHDIAVDPRVLQSRAGAAYPHAQVEILPGSKHSPPLDDVTLRMLADKVSVFLSV
jgi:pimeloyl-ACP methyl ester carboxylesterase